MGTGAVGLQLSVPFSGYGGGSRGELENRISQLERKRDDYKKLQETEGSPELEKKLGELEKRIGELQARLDKVRTDEEQEDGECETCKNRKYQDGSNDPGVSFKMASKVGPEGAESAVRGHENEHVVRNQAKAKRENKEIVYQSVTIKRAICPECGRSYVSGGETKTVTRTKPESRFDVGLPGKVKDKGKILDTAA